MKQSKCKTRPKTFRANENQAMAIELRKQGYTYAEIGTRLKVTAPRAYQYVQKALQEIAKVTLQNAEDLRNLELERLDMAASAIAKAVKAGEINAINTLIRISESRRRLLGIDSPAKLEATGKDGEPLGAPRCGVLVVQGTLTPEEWDAGAREEQAKLMHTTG